MVQEFHIDIGAENMGKADKLAAEVTGMTDEDILASLPPDGLEEMRREGHSDREIVGMMRRIAGSPKAVHALEDLTDVLGDIR
jgi:hypothetical protein